jgi:hypothetical protein
MEVTLGSDIVKPMEILTAASSVVARLTWDYTQHAPQMVALYEHAKQSQWNAATDINWDIDVGFNSPLPDDSWYAMAAFEASPMARYGRSMWDKFRWELQAWMVSQFLHGEQGALVATARLVETLPNIEAKSYAATQVVDEARHVEVFSRYLEQNVSSPYIVSAPLEALLKNILNDSQWDVIALGMQVVVEPLAMSAFRLANSTFHDKLIKQITQLVANDEARHLSFGIVLLEDIYQEMSEAELRYREEFVLEAARLMSRRFLLEDIWERIGIDRQEGMEFAATNEMMIRYRQALFAKVVSGLIRIGMMTSRVRAGFAKLNLLDLASRRAIEGRSHRLRSLCT